MSTHKDRRVRKFLKQGKTDRAEMAKVSMNNRSRRARGKARLRYGAGKVGKIK